MSTRDAHGDFAVYFEGTKATSGRRFFESLCLALTKDAKPLNKRPRAVLFNVSASIMAMVKAKLRRQKIVLRIDGLYSDRLCPRFIATFRWPLRTLLRLGLRYPQMHDFLASFANLVNQNYTAFARILLADHVVYQSLFSRKVHERYFPRKPHDIIVNGAAFMGYGKERKNGDGIELVTIYDDWKPAKRVHDLVEFVRWANEERNKSIRLTILGYTGTIPDSAPPHVRTLIETTPYVRALPRFQTFSGETRKALLSGDAYITFTYRDPCPNTVVEAMAHGLPVVAFASGGVPDIVGNAGVLLPVDDFERGFFTSHRYESDFPQIDFPLVLMAVDEVVSKITLYEERVVQRFKDDLAIEVVAARYASVMKAVAGNAARDVLRSC